MLSRKIIAASISGTVFVILMSLVNTNPFEQKEVSEQYYFYSVLTIIGGYLVYSFPVILLYGVIASIFSDKVANFTSKKLRKENSEIIISGILHIIFGLIILPYSLGASILFFVTDRLLKKQQENFHWSQAIKSFLIPIVVSIVSIGFTLIVDFIKNIDDYLV